MTNQITITDPQDRIKSRLHSLKQDYDINIARFCREAVDAKINLFLEQLSAFSGLEQSGVNCDNFSSKVL
jgi:hypothetical protein